MQYQLAFRYVIDRPGGFINLLLVTVCHLIPVIGPIVALGYQAEVAVALDRDPDMRRHPKFEFDRFVEYLTRGVWPFLIRLLLAIPLGVFLFGVVVAALVIDPPGPNNPPVFLFLLVAGAYAVGLVFYAAVAVPMGFHAELTAKFDLGGAFRFAVGFWKVMAPQAILTGVVFLFLTLVLTVVGLLCCIVGVYPAGALAQLAGQHLMVQLYREYLDRGGEPLAEYESPGRADADEWDDRPDDQW